MKSRLSVVVVVAAVVALVSTSTGAVAASLITSAKIKDKTIQVRDLAPGTVTALRAGGPRIYQTSVTSLFSMACLWSTAPRATTATWPSGAG